MIIVYLLLILLGGYAALVLLSLIALWTATFIQSLIEWAISVKKLWD